jgi:hypothetical protein
VGIKSELIAEMHNGHIPFPSHETVTTVSHSFLFFATKLGVHGIVLSPLLCRRDVTSLLINNESIT